MSRKWQHFYTFLEVQKRLLQDFIRLTNLLESRSSREKEEFLISPFVFSAQIILYHPSDKYLISLITNS